MLDLTPDELLSTTRAVRKRLDLETPVPLELVRECIELATQAPSGSNQQGWHFVVVTDAAKRAALGDIYRRAFDIYETMPTAVGNAAYDDPARAATQDRVRSSARYLADVMGQAPVLVIPCIEGRADHLPNVMASSMLGSIIPAAWSFCLAARARGMGTSWTTLHLMFEEEAAGVVGIPFASITQTALLPLAYTKGTDFKAGPRVALDEIVHVDSW
ncbi:MAG: nitroreductase family protein [Actinomycetota bacterium]|nr:nitroreductase family protein [Actinomycetota bacterium]